jgi:hypothetical protein
MTYVHIWTASNFKGSQNINKSLATTMSARHSPTSEFSSREPSPYQIDEEDSQSTYLGCENQQHYYEKYYDKTGQWPPETGWNPTHLPISDEHSEARESATTTEKKEEGMVSHSHLKTTTFDLSQNNTHRTPVTPVAGPKLCLIHTGPINDSAVSVTQVENPTRRIYKLLRPAKPEGLARKIRR